MTQISELKAAVDLQKLWTHLGGEIRGKRGTCFNKSRHKNDDRNPSVVVRRDSWHCYGCCDHGDAIDLLQKWRGLEWKDAAKYVADYAGLPWDSTRTGPAQIPLRNITRAKKPSRTDLGAGILKELWDIVEPLGLTKAAITWLLSRKINPLVAHLVGCRDWAPVAAQIAEMLRGKSDAEKKAAGFYSSKGKPWAPLAGLLSGKTHSMGLCIPSWIKPAHPSSWRWRLYAPGKLKTICQPGLRPGPLGLYFKSDGWIEPAAGADRIVITEGEPDFLSMIDACQVDASVIGICSVGSGWNPGWTQHILEAERLVVAMHNTPASKRFAAGLGRDLLRRGLNAKGRFRWRPFEEDDDANDWHKRGELRGEVSGWFEGLGG